MFHFLLKGWKINHISCSSFLVFWRPFRPAAATTYCLHSFLSFAASSAFLTSNILRSYFILSTHPCLGRPLGLFVFDIHAVICPRSLFDLHTWPTQFIRALFKVQQYIYSSQICIASYFVFSFIVRFHNKW